MKLQLTAIAAAVTFALSTSAFAQTQQTPTTITSNTNLTGVDWGVDNDNVGGDDAAWGAGPTPSFTSAQNAVDSLGGNAPTSSVTGNNNLSVSTQTGDYNQASIVQTMSRNESQLKQSGSRLKADIQQVKAHATSQYNPGWNAAIDLSNIIIASEAVAKSALIRTESRGGHTRIDFPDETEKGLRYNIVIKQGLDGKMEAKKEMLRFSEDCPRAGTLCMSQFEI